MTLDYGSAVIGEDLEAEQHMQTLDPEQESLERKRRLANERREKIQRHRQAWARNKALLHNAERMLVDARDTINTNKYKIARLSALFSAKKYHADAQEVEMQIKQLQRGMQSAEDSRETNMVARADSERKVAFHQAKLKELNAPEDVAPEDVANKVKFEKQQAVEQVKVVTDSLKKQLQDHSAATAATASTLAVQNYAFLKKLDFSTDEAQMARTGKL